MEKRDSSLVISKISKYFSRKKKVLTREISIFEKICGQKTKYGILSIEKEDQSKEHQKRKL